MRLHALQHIGFEDLAFIMQWADMNGHSQSSTLLFADQELPAHDEYDCLVILGGPMNIYEERKYSWLVREKHFIEHAMKGNKCVLGICLGAQLIADVLGGRITKNEYREIGWFPVTQTEGKDAKSLISSLPSSFAAFHWHGDTFSIPPGCKRIAKSNACENQAFQYNDRVLGLQFHLESTRESIMALVDNCSDEITGGPYVQTEAAIRNKLELLSESNRHMKCILNNLVANYETKKR